ncbi:MAG: lytic transglycosylase domain-containing protein [Myxococcota bacterium]
MGGRMAAAVALVTALLSCLGAALWEPPAVLDVLESDTVAAEELHALLLLRDRQLQRLQRRVADLDDGPLLQDAERLGILAAVQSSGLPPHVQKRVAVAILRESRRHELDPLLVVAVIRTESSFHSFAVSQKGAMGLMQVMPDTGRWLAERQGVALGRDTNLFDPELNVALATSYLSELVRRFGSLRAALVAYNAGPTAAREILADRELRTRFYAGYPTKVLKEYRRLQKRAAVLGPSPA